MGWEKLRPISSHATLQCFKKIMKAKILGHVKHMKKMDQIFLQVKVIYETLKF